MGGGPSDQGLIGFGDSGTVNEVIGNPINLTGGAGQNLNFALSVPRDGTITSIASLFSVAVTIPLTTISTITARVYISTPPSIIFTQVAAIPLPVLPAGAVPGTSVSDVAPLSIPVSAGDRLLIVFSAESTSNGTIDGYASAGLTIE